MPRNGSGVYSLPAGSTAVPNTTIESAKYNTVNADIAADLNAARPITAGGTGETTSAGVVSAFSIVQYASQTLTNAQQRQAKQNIGAPFSLYTNNGAADYTVVAADNGRTIGVNATAAARVVSMPLASSVGVGFNFTIRKIGSGINTVTLTPSGSDVINNAASFILRVAHQTVTLQVTASGFWEVVADSGVDAILYGQTQSLTAAQQGQAIANIGGGVLAGFRNKVINGNFDIWQRGASQTSNSYGSVDRWYCGHVGSTKTHSRQSFALGQTSVPGNPAYFSRTVVASVAGVANYVNISQSVEGVQALAGKTVTLTFYAKADANKPISAELNQYFGSGGSPSADVSGIGATKFDLTTSWQKFTVVVALPSVSGKVLGTNVNDALRVSFWFDAGSNWNARSANLGQQSGTFDIAHVSLVEGDATAEADPFSPRHIQQEEALCLRYFEMLRESDATTFIGMCQFDLTTLCRGIVTYARKRAVPTFAVTGIIRISIPNGANVDGTSPTWSSADKTSVELTTTQTGLTAGQCGFFYLNTGASVAVDAEL